MRAVHRYAKLSSTMRRAAELAAEGCPAGTVVVADEQTAGQGRHGRSWHSEPGAGLYMSQVLRVKICPDTLPVVTLALGLAARDAILSTTGLVCDLRWPNDLLIDGRKCAGILVQLDHGALVAGIGVNVNHTAMPEELRDVATSLRIASGREHSVDKLLEALMPAVDGAVEALMAQGKDPVLRLFSEASSYVRGRRVTVEQPGGAITGTTDGLDRQGFLVLREDSGKRSIIIAGGVRPCS